MSKVACFDNPDTMMREAYVDGHIIMGMSAALVKQTSNGFTTPLELNHGPWKEGQIVGDQKAIDRDWGNG